MYLGRWIWRSIYSCPARKSYVAPIQAASGALAGGTNAATLYFALVRYKGQTAYACPDVTQACHLQITLIDQNEQFVFKPLLYELINGGAKPEEVAPLFADLVAPMTSTSFVQVRLLSLCLDTSTRCSSSTY